ncbi:uncharacterized protein LOC135693183 [Rhopilema esculentum]|uniref:uncharacterized protein LOC135693183 n=1 Tax=Rhopilema esculentum TaxID=499914 RepID=UPI0031CF131B
MESLEKAKKRRKIFRTSVTKTANKVKELVEDSESIEEGTLEYLKAELKEKQTEIKKSDEEILELLLEYVEEEEQLDKEMDEVGEYKILNAIYSINCLLNTKEEPKNSIARSVSKDSLNSEVSSLSPSSRNVTRKTVVKLPKLELQKFTGKIHEWPEFWDGFQSVHKNPDLAACDKFKYLKSFLEESA